MRDDHMIQPQPAVAMRPRLRQPLQPIIEQMHEAAADNLLAAHAHGVFPRRRVTGPHSSRHADNRTQSQPGRKYGLC